MKNTIRIIYIKQIFFLIPKLTEEIKYNLLKGNTIAKCAIYKCDL